MSVQVVRNTGRGNTFNTVTNWFVGPDCGVLTLVDENGAAVATYAGGEWAFVQLIEPPRVARVWDSLADVPHDVSVHSKGGVYWSFWDPERRDEHGQTLANGNGEWFWGSTKSKPNYVWAGKGDGPFTEILEDK